MVVSERNEIASLPMTRQRKIVVSYQTQTLWLGRRKNARSPAPVPKLKRLVAIERASSCRRMNLCVGALLTKSFIGTKGAVAAALASRPVISFSGGVVVSRATTALGQPAAPGAALLVGVAA